MNRRWKRPLTAAEVVKGVRSAEEFGRNLRDWQHELRKVGARSEFARRIAHRPNLLREILHDHGQCDAYLAAYVEWLCNRHGIDLPEWVNESARNADRAWYDYPPLWTQSFLRAPGPFRRRGVFTEPEDVFRPRPGRPPVSKQQKRAANAERQRRHRERVRARLRRLAELEIQSKNDPDGE